MTTASTIHDTERGSVRADDPETSQWAADSIADATTSQDLAMAILRDAHRQGVTRFTRHDVEALTTPTLSPSRARTAVRELMDKGLIETTGDYERTRSGRRAQVLTLTQKAVAA